MEAVATDSVASPALNHLTLGVFGGVDTWATDPALNAMETLVNDVAEVELPLIPRSVGAILPLLSGSPDRLAVALDAILRFDLHEASEGLAVLVWRGHPEAVVAGAALAARPDTPSDFTELVRAHMSDLGEEWQQDLFLSRLDRAHRPRFDSVAADREIRWPPENPSNARFAFAAVQPPTKSFSWHDHYRIVLDLVANGIVARRLSSQENTHIGWIPRWVPVIGPTAPVGTFTIRRPPAGADLHQLVERVAAVTPNAWRPRHSALRPEQLAPLEVTQIEVFNDGAMPRSEVAYLAGLRSSQFEGLRKYENLAPIHYRGFAYWTFAQVVGLRAARYLFTLSGRRRGLGDVADRLVALTRQNQQVPVAITMKGEVLIKENDELYDVETGQLVHEGILSFVDEVYEPFVLPNREVPRLLRPAENVTVHPGVVAGLPCVRGTRISVGSIGNALAAARASRKEAPVDFVADAFAIPPEQVGDAERVANDMRASL